MKFAFPVTPLTARAILQIFRLTRRAPPLRDARGLGIFIGLAPPQHRFPNPGNGAPGKYPLWLALYPFGKPRAETPRIGPSK